MSASAHGHTPAAWTGVTITFLGFCVAGAAVVMVNIPLMIVGFAVVLLGGVVGKVMQMMGMGKPQPNPPLRREDTARRAASDGRPAADAAAEEEAAGESAGSASGKAPVNH